jgi:hypothetical protein
MKKILITGSFIMAITVIGMTSCEPSHKGTGTPGTTDTLSTMQNQNGGMDSTMHTDTSHHKK